MAYYEMLAADQWTTNRQVAIPAAQKITFKLALSVIGVCGFSFPLTWNEHEISEDGSMSIQQALRIVADTASLSFAPRWVKNLPFKYFRDSKTAQEQLAKFLKEQIIKRRAAILHGGIGLQDDSKSNTVFDLLIKARKTKEGNTQ
ncbi:uncharacterized protein EV420DRAFT_1643436 [Desarmillaria tabescens]|uniref:Uncharacterized protein n=1 Tax=Armillaria tabescens TaxID=1929756 RepID=A0AA39KBH9_ARMTA|nr:uncharacterized protein EV420DRAFT_1643436 [Desarmillaria tabescens]KAK0458099.1 hypothetical protein EV420DRAFT_1643436 [Desarmillaria tabescens]